jgi:hypothetical protein
MERAQDHPEGSAFLLQEVSRYTYSVCRASSGFTEAAPSETNPPLRP